MTNSYLLFVTNLLLSRKKGLMSIRLTKKLKFFSVIPLGILLSNILTEPVHASDEADEQKLERSVAKYSPQDVKMMCVVMKANYFSLIDPEYADDSNEYFVRLHQSISDILFYNNRFELEDSNEDFSQENIALITRVVEDARFCKDVLTDIDTDTLLRQLSEFSRQLFLHSEDHNLLITVMTLVADIINDKEVTCASVELGMFLIKEQFFTIYPEKSLAYYNLALQNEGRTDFDDLRSDDHAILGYVHIGKSNGDADYIRTGLKHFEKAITNIRYRDSCGVHMAMGLAKTSLRDSEGAIQHYLKAVEFGNNFLPTNHRLKFALSYFRLNDFQRAKEQYEQIDRPVSELLEHHPEALKMIMYFDWQLDDPRSASAYVKVIKPILEQMDNPFAQVLTEFELELSEEENPEVTGDEPQNVSTTTSESNKSMHPFRRAAIENHMYTQRSQAKVMFEGADKINVEALEQLASRNGHSDQKVFAEMRSLKGQCRKVFEEINSIVEVTPGNAILLRRKVEFLKGFITELSDRNTQIKDLLASIMRATMPVRKTNEDSSATNPIALPSKAHNEKADVVSEHAALPLKKKTRGVSGKTTKRRSPSPAFNVSDVQQPEQHGIVSCSDTVRMIRDGQAPKGFPAHLIDSTQGLIQMLDASESLNAFRASLTKGHDFKYMSNLQRYQVRINDTYRIRFDYKDGCYQNVDVGDFH